MPGPRTTLALAALVLTTLGCNGNGPAAPAKPAASTTPATPTTPTTPTPPAPPTITIPPHANEQEPAAAAIAALRAAPAVLESSALHTDSSTGRFLTLDAADKRVTGVVVKRDSRGVIDEVEVLADGVRHGPHVHWTSDEGTPLQAGWWHHGEPVGVHRRWHRPPAGDRLEFVGVLAGPLGGPRVEYTKDGKLSSSEVGDGSKLVPDDPPIDRWAAHPGRPAWADKPAPTRPADLPVLTPK